MDNLYIELRTLHRGSMSHDIAQHLFTRQFLGRVLVISDRPSALASAIGKQWQQLCREVQRARSSTLQTARLREMDREVAHMQQFRILAQSEMRPASTANVLVAELQSIPPLTHFQTVYITCKLPEDALTNLLQALPLHAVVVRY